ncbi:MAG: hypothetical protein WAU70_14670 [Flavobacteriales bacterium]
MRVLVISLVLLASCSALAQGFRYPTLPDHVDRAVEMVPANWTMIDTAKGDLNADSVGDLAFVLQYSDTVTEMRPDSVESSGPPRLLIVLVRDIKQGGYSLALTDTTFILRSDEGGQALEPFDEILIEEGLLGVKHEFVRSHWEHWFRWIDGVFRLVSATSAGVHLDSFQSITIDFERNTGTLEWGFIGDEENEQVDLSLHLEHLRSIGELRMPGRWEVLPDIFL